MDNIVSLNYHETCEFSSVAGSVFNYGCNPVTCQPLLGYTCTNPLLCTKCGDGILTAGETCDAPGTPGSNGCTVDCKVDSTYWSCTTQYDSVRKVSYSQCTHVPCGNGNRNATAGENCDDGNNANGDGCTSTCQIETYW